MGRLTPFFGIHTHHRIARLLIALDPLPNFFKLRIALRMGSSGLGFERFTATEMMLLEQLIHDGHTDRYAGFCQQQIGNLLTAQMGPLNGPIHRGTRRMLLDNPQKGVT